MGAKGFFPLHMSKSLTLKTLMKMSDRRGPVSYCFIVLPVIVSFEVGKHSLIGELHCAVDISFLQTGGLTHIQSAHMAASSLASVS